MKNALDNPTFPTLTDQDVDDLNDLHGPWTAYPHPMLPEAFATHDRQAKRASRSVPKRKKVIGYIYEGSNSLDGARD